MKYELESMQNVTEEKKNYREKKKKEKKESDDLQLNYKRLAL